MSLSVHIFYHTYCTASFVVTRNLKALIQAVKKYASIVDVVENLMLCDHSTEAITFSIPQGNPGGWHVVGQFKPPMIATRLIREYRPGKTPPSILLRMKWAGFGDPIEDTVEIGIEGALLKSFSLCCRPEHTGLRV